MSNRRRRLGVLVASALALSTSAGAEGVPVVVRIAGGDAATRVAIEASSRSSVSMSQSVLLGTTRGVRLDLPSQEPWSLRAKAEGFWSPSLDWPQGATSVTLTLFPAAEVAFALRTPRGLRPPSELRLRLRQPSGNQRSARQPSEAEVTCPVDEQGVAACTVPAGSWDIRAKGPGFVPHYLWATSIPAGKRLGLGTLALKEGISLVGRVVTETGPADLQQTRVELRPAVDPDSGPTAVPPEVQRLDLSVGINTWGYFQFDALAPGSYVLTARQEGFEANTSPIVMSDVDMELADPIVLLRPLQLRVSIDPPADPVHGEWRVLLRAIRAGKVVTLAEGSADPGGNWRSPAVTPGSYTVEVQDRTGSLLASRKVDVSRDAQELWIELAFVHVEGEVRVGDEPLAAKLWFGGRSRGPERIEVEANEEGEFALTLPRAGRWLVDVQGRNRIVNVAGLAVTVKPPANGPARVSITLPDTLIHGTVRDSAMRPVGGATVLLVPIDRPEGVVSAATDSLGEFEIRGQLEGNYSVEARAADKVSDRTQIVVAEGLAPPRLDLVIAERRQLRGRVVSRNGPVAGAWILGFPISAKGSLAAMLTPQARAGVDGSFALELPPDTAQVRLIVMAPGFTLALATTQLADAPNSLIVTLDQVQGRLEIARSSPGQDGEGIATVPLVLIDGQPVDVPLLVHWAQAHGGVGSRDDVLAVDAMPPGAYWYCELAPQEALLVFSGAAAPKAGACSEGYLSAGAVLALQRPMAR